MHRAAAVGAVDVCEFLLSIGAEVNAPDCSGRTALHWATIAGFDEVIKILLAHNADIFATSLTKMSALHLACETSKCKAAEALLGHFTEAKFGIEAVVKKNEFLALKNNDDKTACDIAVSSKNAPMVTILKENGDPNAASAACNIS